MNTDIPARLANGVHVRGGKVVLHQISRENRESLDLSDSLASIIYVGVLPNDIHFFYLKLKRGVRLRFRSLHFSRKD